MPALKSFSEHKKIVASSETMNSHDSSVIIEINDSPANATRKSTRKPKWDVEDNGATMLCEFPVGQSDTVTVSSQDYATLQLNTFLNDIIIDFYLTHLFYNVLPSESRDSVHIFSTMFYKRLLQTPTKDAKKVAAFETDPSISYEEKRHLRVAGWTKNVDLFSKDLVIIPICEHSHWYLVVVVKPGLVDTSEDTEEGNPLFLVLDSLGGIKRSAVANLRQFLCCEWRSKKCGGEDPKKELQFSSSQMGSIYPNKPEQENGSDCGVFLLHYVEKIFEKLDQFLWPHLPDLSQWFTLEEVGKKRGEIAGLIQRLAKQQRMEGNTPKFPSIKFKAGTRARKTLKLVDRSLSKDVNENEEVKSLKLTRLLSSKRILTTSTYSIRDRQKKPCNSSSTWKESDSVEDFAFDPSIYSVIKTKCSEKSYSSSDVSMTLSSSVAASLDYSNTITTVSSKSSHGTLCSAMTSSAASNGNAMSSAAISSSSTTSIFPTGKKASFLEVWNANKDDLVIGDYVQFRATSTATNGLKVNRKRHGLKMLKSLQLSTTDDRIRGSNEVPNRKVK